MGSSDALVFYPETHEYFTQPGRDGGRPVPSVTTILRAVGVSADFEHVAAATLEFSRQLGSAVHVDCHAFDDDDLELATVDLRVLPYLQAWTQFREATGLVPIARERRVYHPVYDYCGTLDGIFTGPGGQQVLIDVKTGDPEDAGAQFQTAAYQAAYVAEHPDARIDERWSVQLVPGRAVPYRITPYTDFRDFKKFQAFLVTYHEQPQRRRRIR